VASVAVDAEGIATANDDDAVGGVILPLEEGVNALGINIYRIVQDEISV
jgi:hypothetical protein